MGKNLHKRKALVKILRMMGLMVLILLIALGLFISWEFKDEIAGVRSVQELIGPEETRSYPLIIGS